MVEAQYSDDVKGGNLDLPIDKASIEAFVAENDTVGKLTAQAREAGFNLISPDLQGNRDLLDIDLRDLVSVLDRLGIETIAEFDSILRDTAMSKVIDTLGEALAKMQWQSPLDVITTLVLYSQGASDDLFASIYDSKTADVLCELRKDEVA